MKRGLRWKLVALAGCVALWTAAIQAADAARPVESRTARGNGRYLLASKAELLQGGTGPFTPLGCPCQHELCPPGSATFLSGLQGVLSVHPGDSFVHLFVRQNPNSTDFTLHSAWLIWLPSKDWRFWLFEEWEPKPGKIRKRWVVEKCGECFNHCHSIWYRQVTLGVDEGDYRQWRFVDCAHKTCMRPDAVPRPKDLGDPPPGLGPADGEPASPAGPPPGAPGGPASGSPPPGNGDEGGFQPRRGANSRAPESPGGQIERAPNATEVK